jgi:tetratricopeptide (TPR) repeat protein
MVDLGVRLRMLRRRRTGLTPTTVRFQANEIARIMQTGHHRSNNGKRADAHARVHHVALLIAGIACVLTLMAQRASAQPTGAAAVVPEDTRPWAAGVPKADQDAALELYIAGNREFAESRFAQALALYKQALERWDHPAIRFNAAVCFINLDQPLEAHDNLEHSLAYGEPALGAAAYAQGLTYRKLLGAQLARLTITCQQPGTQVSLDGKVVFTGPGSIEQVVLPGEHQVVAAKPGLQTASKMLVAVAGRKVAYDANAIPLAGPKLVRRWSTWLPWAVLAGSAALAAGGTWSYVAAGHNFDRYDTLVAARCAQRCSAEKLASFADLRRYQDRGNAEQFAAFTLFVAGGTALLGGVVGLIVNQPRVESRGPYVQPVVAMSGQGTTISLRWAFR